MTRSPSSAVRRAALPVVLAVSLWSPAAAPAAGAAGPPSAVISGVVECDPGASAARVAVGDEGRYPNDLTRAGAADAEGLLAARVRQAGLAAVSRLGDLRKLRVTVPLRVHVITRDDGSGAPSPAALAGQLDVLNSAFAGDSGATAPTVFRFVVASIDYTANTDWYDWSLFADTDDQEAKAALHVGGRADLNVYITGLEDALGYATFPFEEPLNRDGVVIYSETLPGGGMGPYSLGDNLVHEVGHWLGLFHTFENGCESPGDGVPDTPYQHDGDNIVSCSEIEDSCPAPGRDPVHNYMSYSDDVCRDRFSAGQSVRMGLAWLVFRASPTQLEGILG